MSCADVKRSCQIVSVRSLLLGLMKSAHVRLLMSIDHGKFLMSSALDKVVMTNARIKLLVSNPCYVSSDGKQIFPIFLNQLVNRWYREVALDRAEYISVSWHFIKLIKNTHQKWVLSHVRKIRIFSIFDNFFRGTLKSNHGNLGSATLFHHAQLISVEKDFKNDKL